MQRLALALSIVALALAAWAALRPAPPTADGKCVCDTRALQSELSRLEQTVTRLDAADGLRGELTEIRSRINGLKAQLAQSPAPAFGLAGPGAAPRPVPVGMPVVPGSAAAPEKMYQRFEAPEFLSVFEAVPGQIQVINRDPSQTGKTFKIPAVNADGDEVEITVTAPAPR
ncbi:MAG: hypothetical protein KC613_18500 [Myxococcales bacterium]|nr:hypothetical protein [Myxococcales bacterium]